MALTATFRRHHAEVTRLIERIDGHLAVENLGRDPGAVIRLIREIHEKFDIHLSLEDALLYPRLASHADPSLRAMAHSFRHEMGRMRSEFEEYRRRWTGPLAISRDMTTYAAATRQLLGTLAQRIRNEEEQLFAAADRLAPSDKPAPAILPRISSPLPRRRLALALKEAIRTDEMFLHYQPIYDLYRERIIGVEALARWNHPQFGPIPPNLFITVAEEYGLIGQLGRWALEEACRQLAAWRKAGLDIGMSVNVSPLQLAEGKRFTILAEETAARLAIPPNQLELDVPESALAHHDQAETVCSLVARGFGVAIDDFGTGHSSLAYLRAFRKGTLKIDRAFISSAPGGLDDCVLVDAIVRLAHGLGMKVAAEGVEAEEQIELLRRAGCDLAQGFAISRPTAAEQIPGLLAGLAGRPEGFV
jgi:EAL domain-containing protein (putative c-di-GMP-specific phosphodiesterase class I)